MSGLMTHQEHVEDLKWIHKMFLRIDTNYRCIFDNFVAQKAHIIPRRSFDSLALPKENNILRLCASHHFQFDHFDFSDKEWQALRYLITNEQWKLVCRYVNGEWEGVDERRTGVPVFPTYASKQSQQDSKT